MAATSPIVLILGAGSNIGQSAVRAFAAKGYKIALASRTLKEEESTANQVNISADFSDPDSITTVFSKVKASLGLPSVVVYNAATASPGDPKNPLALPLNTLTRSLNINTTSAFVAAQQAALSFEQLPDSASKTFIYTGNILNTTVMPALLDLGIGKSAMAHIIENAATAYADRGYKFYYADERNADGSPVIQGTNGDAHAELFIKLAEGKSQGPWQQTFVKDMGYKTF